MSEEYTYAVARVRALEASLLTDAVIDQLLACKDERQCLQLLEEKGWGSHETTGDISGILKQEEEKTWAVIRDVAPDLSLFDVLSYSKLYHNLKAAVKVVCTQAPAEKIDFSNVKIEPLFEEMVDFETFSKSDFRAVKIKECSAVPKSKKLLKFVLDDGTGTDRVILSGIHEYYEPEQLVGKTAIAIVNLPPRKMMGIDSCGMLISAVHEEDGHEGLNLLMVDDRIPAGAKLY